MAYIPLLLAFSVLFSSSFASDSFDSILSDPRPCEESCVKSYSPHTNPSGGGESEACSRGCRLYTISEFVIRSGGSSGGLGEDSDAPPHVAAKESCFGACIEAYNETSGNTVACKSGCEAQQEKGKKAKEQTAAADDNKSSSSIHLLTPLVQVRSIYSSVVGAIHVIRSSVITYFAADDNSIVAVESSPNIMVEVDEKAGETGGGGGGDDDELVLMPMDGVGRVEMAGMGMDESKAGEAKASSSEPSVVRCVSRRLGVPPPLLVASTLVLVLFTIYVIFAVCTTATPPKASKEGLSVQSDPMPLPVKLVLPEDLTHLSLMEDDDLNAPPLPAKIKLPDTHV